MTNIHCPYLLNWDAQGRPIAPIEYPSFENHCLGLHDGDSLLGDSLLLADQATFCLSGGHRFCARYAALAAEQAPTEPNQPFQRPSTAPSTPLSSPFIPLESKQPSTQYRTNQYSDNQFQAKPAPIFEQPSNPVDTPNITVAENWADQPTGRYAQPYNAASLTEDPFDDQLTAVPEYAWYHSWLPPATRWWAWASALLFFVMVIGMGGLVAAYTGWQLALDQLATARGAQVSTLASAAIQQQTPVQPIYLVLTATSEPVAEGVNAQQTDPQPGAPQQAAPIVIEPRTGQAIKPDPVVGDLALDPQNNQQNAFPVAVTATPVIIIVPLPTTADAGVSAPATNNTQLQPTAIPDTIQLPPPTIIPTPIPVINVQVPVPSRRPTPEFDIPTSTPEPLAQLEQVGPTPTNTLAPLLGPPIVVFAPDESAVPPGKCTKVRWHVENVRAVYYESQPAFGDGDQTECLKDKRDTFALTVTFGDGQTKIYTTTIGIIEPTVTPSITPSFTPEIAPTETWTPMPPTATPTPNVVYGTTLSVNGDNPARCNPGETCTIGVLATNTGDTLDTLAIEIVSMGSWSAAFCSQIGTCGSPRLVVANVGPANTVYLNLQITIPAEAAGQSSRYAIRAVSEGSGNVITSQVTELTININD